MSVNGILTGQNTQRVKPVTSDQYDSLSSEAKAADIVYVVTDDEAPTDTVYSKTQVDSLLASVVQQEVVVVELDSYSGGTATVSNAAITSSHVVISSTLGTPAVQTGDWTVTTSNGSLTLSGTASGATTVRLVLGKPGTTVS